MLLESIYEKNSCPKVPRENGCQEVSMQKSTYIVEFILDIVHQNTSFASKSITLNILHPPQ
jgi:hypothetical protein